MKMVIPFYKKIISYIWPVILERGGSDVNPVLEISLESGRIVLNTKNANYSRGSLHRVMHKALKLAVKEYGSKMENVLLLGYGGGSAAALIRDTYNPNAAITAFELDEKVQEIAEKWFPIENIEIVIGDAQKLIRSDQNKYDLIISDIFLDTAMPGFSIQQPFYSDVKNRLVSKGVFVQNLMATPEDMPGQLKKFGEIFSDAGMVHVFGANWLLFGRM